MGELVSTVYVHDEHGRMVPFGPGDDVPDWAAAQMGEHCFVDGKKPSKQEPKSSAKKTARAHQGKSE